MDRDKLIEDIKEYFKIHEFVGRKTYDKHGESAWKFFDDDLLKCILIIRKELNRPITINNWKYNGQFSQRGLRTTLQQLYKSKISRGILYLSAHTFGKAVDFDVKGMSATDVRKWIVDNADLFPCKIRLERNLKGKPISWVHLDTFWEEKNPKVYEFDV